MNAYFEEQANNTKQPQIYTHKKFIMKHKSFNFVETAQRIQPNIEANVMSFQSTLRERSSKNLFF